MGKLNQDHSTTSIENKFNLFKTQDLDDDYDGTPIIDLSSITHLEIGQLENTILTENKEVASIVCEIGDACEKWGFFKVVNHGIPLEEIHKLQLNARKFFSLSEEEKMKVSRNEFNPMGYMDSEYTGPVKDTKEAFGYSVKEPCLAPCAPDETPSMEFVNRWPDYPSEFREAAKVYGNYAEKLGLMLLEMIALSLGLAANGLTKYCVEQSAIARILYYPKPCLSSDDTMNGIAAHTDSEVLTIIAQDDVNGLQLKRRSDGKWIDVKHIPGALFVNLGDIIQVWSNDKYYSVEHKVVLNPKKDRLSIGVFLGASYHVNVKPLEEFVDENNPPKYKEYNWGAFRAGRVLSYVKELKHEVQISEFKTTEN